MILKLSQKLNVKKAAEKALGIKPGSGFFHKPTKPTNISKDVRSVEEVIKYLVDNQDRIENLAIVTKENGDVESRWSRMKQSDVLYLSKVFSIEVEDTIRGVD